MQGFDWLFQESNMFRKFSAGARCSDRARLLSAIEEWPPRWRAVCRIEEAQKGDADGLGAVYRRPIAPQGCSLKMAAPFKLRDFQGVCFSYRLQFRLSSSTTGLATM